MVSGVNVTSIGGANGAYGVCGVKYVNSVGGNSGIRGNSDLCVVEINCEYFRPPV